MTPEPAATTAGDPLGAFLRWQWWFRAIVYVSVSAIVLVRPGALAPKLAESVIGGLGMAAWWWAARAPSGRAGPMLAAALTVLTADGAFAAPSHHETSVIALAIMAGLEAGLELADAAVGVLVLTGIVAAEVGAVVYGDTDLGTVLGYPLLMVALTVAGRYRRVFRRQAEQAQALLAQTERARVEHERAAALDERSRIAREIHDVLAHSLGALGIQLQAAEAMLSERGDIDSAVAVLIRARRIAEEGVTETRRAVHALRADTPPLPEALAALVEGDPERLTVNGEPVQLGPAPGLALLRVAQESVTNAGKHAAGHPPVISLTYGERDVVLRVVNGLAGAPDASPLDWTGGYGLAGMHERLRMIGGQLTAGVTDGHWVVEATVSL